MGLGTTATHAGTVPEGEGCPSALSPAAAHSSSPAEPGQRSGGGVARAGTGQCPCRKRQLRRHQPNRSTMIGTSQNSGQGTHT